MRSSVLSVLAVAVLALAVHQSINVDASTSDLEEQDDAGTGGDAADKVSIATGLPGPGAYRGRLADTDQQDWYKLEAPGGGAGCMELKGRSLNGETVRARLGAGPDGKIVRASFGGNPVTMGLAVSDLGNPVAGFARSTDDVSLPADYDFEMQASSMRDLGPADAGTGHDAGPTSSSAIPISAGCLMGTLGASPGDSRDSYTFEGASGDRAVLSLGQDSGSGAVRASLLDPAGIARGDTTAGGTVALVLDASGTWTVRVEVAEEPVESDSTASTAGVGASSGIALAQPGGAGASAVSARTDYSLGLCVPHCFDGGG